MVVGMFFFFFFSSRRRHTRLQGDWSSDVCSSDLVGSLRVEYDGRTLRWLLERVEQKPSGGRLQKALIRNEEKIIGWYLYHLNRGGIADVLQIAATPSSVHDVLDHLFYQAWRQGAIAVNRRLEPRFLQALSGKYCPFHRRRPWMRVSGKQTRLV